MLTHPTCIWHPAWGDPGRILRRSLASENYCPWAIVWFVCVILHLAVLVEHRLVTDGRTDGRTDRQTQGHGQYRGCTALHGKNWLPWQRPWSDRNRISQQPSTPVRLPIWNLVTIGHILSEITGLQPIVRSSAIAKGPRNALCQLKTCKMSHKYKCSSNCILHMISPATREWPSRSLEMTRIEGPYDTSY